MNKTSNTYGVVSVEQFNLIYNTTKCPVTKLWAACWISDSFGNRYNRLVGVDISPSSFKRARKEIEDAGLFEFKEIIERLPSGRCGVVGYMVKNLKPHKFSGSKPSNGYRKFLQSDYWKECRELVLTRDKKSCQNCGNKKKLQVHHLTYKNHRNEREHLEDLVTLCRDCHEKEHSASK